MTRSVFFPGTTDVISGSDGGSAANGATGAPAVLGVLVP